MILFQIKRTITIVSTGVKILWVSWSNPSFDVKTKTKTKQQQKNKQIRNLNNSNTLSSRLYY